MFGMAAALGAVPFFAQAAQIYLDPASGKYAPGVTFAVNVRIDTNSSQCINAAEVDISYPKDLLQAVKASDGDSIFSVWVKEPTTYPDYGLISLVGGLPGGYCGRVAGDPSLSNTLATLYFRFPTSTVSGANAQPQTAPITFLSSTKVILNDGNGTVAPLTVSGANYTQILKGQYAPVDTWAEAIENDTTPPEPFTVGVYRDPSLFGNEWFAAFSATDKQTGIDHYEVAEVPPSQVSAAQEQWPWKRAISPYLITDQTLADTIAVRAIDSAGNIRTQLYNATGTQKTAPSHGSILPYLAIIGLVGLALIQLIFRVL